MRALTNQELMAISGGNDEAQAPAESETSHENVLLGLLSIYTGAATVTAVALRTTGITTTASAAIGAGLLAPATGIAGALCGMYLFTNLPHLWN